MPPNVTDRRTQILQAATRVLKDSGVQALSFEAVAREGNVSRQLVRYYFADLDALIVALCEYLGNGYRDMLVNGILKVGQVERLPFFLDFFFDLADGNPMPDNLEAYDSLLAFAVGSDALRERLCGQYLTLGQVVVHELAIAYPDMDRHACEELSFIFVAMMHANWSFVATLGYAQDHGRVMRKAIDRLIASYAAEAEHVPMIEKPWTRAT